MRDVERIIERVRQVSSAVEVRQLQVRHPGADDDGLWFFNQPNSPFEVQIESWNGTCPFLVETAENDARFTANSVEEAVQILSALLHLASSHTDPSS